MNMVNGFHKSVNIDMRVGYSNSISHLRANTTKTNTGNVFGAQCKVTISREGRKLSDQMKASEPKRFTAASTERLLLRQHKQDEMSKSEQSDTLSEISELMHSIKSSYSAGEDKETIANKQEALNRLLDLKAQQEEENKQRVKDAASSAAGASKEQEEIDRKNADLYLMLKTLEEKDEEDGVESTGAKSDTEDDGQGSVGDQFQESASMLGVSAAKRELEAKGMIDDMYNSGYGRLAKADAMMHEIQEELDLAAESLGKANLSEDEKNQLMSEHIGRANNMMMSNYGEMMDLRRKGHQEIQDAKELELKHIAINPLDGVDKAKQTILDAGAAAALHEVSQNTLDKASEELKERVQEEIDKRNDNVSGSEEDEVQEKIEEAAEEKEAEKLEEKELEQEQFEKKSNFMN
ncbi:MAG: hypothetical protein K2N44_14940 [Lachnospiraceae bacterium]|nr:hypothetical protein [Lachnospiraceae bacterium]